ncbi:MAG: DNA alkylation repair protein [Pseudomonadota bacterium]
MELQVLRAELNSLADAAHAAVSRRFFKTGPGDYGEGDTFVGIRVPLLRGLAKKYNRLSCETAVTLLKSPIHEERHLALFILMQLYKRGDEGLRERIYRLYLENTAHINNWDLVDTSAEHIVGDYLLEKDKSPLHLLALSEDLWERRVAIIATFCYIKQNQFEETIKIAGMLLQDKQDLIHKAVGWMLREMGKRDLTAETAFIDTHYKVMPRTMLRYAIERYPEPLRQAYFKGTR